MRVYVIRHAEAVALGEQGVKQDEERPLTPHGFYQCQSLAETLRRLGVSVSVLLTSPLVRARQTAEKVLTAPTRLQMCEPLAPGGKKRHVIEELRALNVETAGVVGHNPDLSELVGWLLGNKMVGIELEKAGAACVYFEGKPDKGAGTLEWLITPAWSEVVAGQPVGSPG